MCNYIVTEEVQPLLKKPLGKLYPNIPEVFKKDISVSDNNLIIAIGDVTTKNLVEYGVIPNLSILDFKTKRDIPVDIPHTFKKVYNVDNPAGTISQTSMEIIKYLSDIDDREVALIVTGEEDLLTIPVIKYFPIGCYIFYGQPDEGVVVVKITEELKHYVNEILFKFRKSPF
ncbi:GTP-dependent dephospho-CoA kinase family protein [Methanococcus voltae]|jgi:uncharacterized protein (UPF0218 family)|uniref:GTP-dependent dephospho-CoA kinase n=2 Tax=Methanococcus voltae TaxID=2188 RepID=A0A8J7RIM3_METVO|nr:DUF359 domain-containing protein [Methanococcus voltae]MBP2172497.1 uncharacterized protein (UPF0218 family) [Methanococcus voltae]MBP2201596.1 uncharacterized protein (UPF0218 family) [Methanococcus voltae]MCS3922385.1 uncharacterized protein (UPF0218 family) [Methanococcus voltae PS]